MILGLDRQPAARCFEEIDRAVNQMTLRQVVFNAHAFPFETPAGIVYNFENHFQLSGDAYEVLYAYPDYLWDFSERNCDWWERPVKHVPVGYHPSMEVGLPRNRLDFWDVVFTGAMNPRRQLVVDELKNRGLSVCDIPHGTYGLQRDAILASGRVSVNMLYYETGVFPALRAAHLAANKIPFVQERCPENWHWLPVKSHYDSLATTIYRLAKASDKEREQVAEYTYEAFKSHPMVLPV